MKYYFLYLLSLFGFFATSYTGDYQKSVYLDDVHILYKNVSKFAYKEYNLRCSGTGGEMMNGIHGIYMSFDVNEDISDDQITDILKSISNKIIELGNANPIIKEASDGGELSRDQIRIDLFISKKLGRDYSVIKLSRGKVRYVYLGETIHHNVVRKEFPLHPEE